MHEVGHCAENDANSDLADFRPGSRYGAEMTKCAVAYLLIASVVVVAVAGCGSNVQVEGSSPDPFTSVVPAPTGDGGQQSDFSVRVDPAVGDAAKGQPCTAGEGALGVDEQREQYACSKGRWVHIIWEPPKVGETCPGDEIRYFYQNSKATHECMDGRWQLATNKG
ncbi:hypothetical protein ABTY35_35195 [Streptomyces fimicarius]|uniref:hypothetical protein n=1 Tax=Streptomyces TaxID=1883 RepID=UPI0011803B99|nr:MULTISPECIES: hypothetical protein [Streptomyces]WKN14582.1 hypothetical protein NEH83_10370 [Streptomyces sp. JUS-F4]